MGSCVHHRRTRNEAANAVRFWRHAKASAECPAENFVTLEATIECDVEDSTPSSEQPHELKEKRMFGGLACTVNGLMCCGVVGKDFVVCTGPDQYDEALAQPDARPMDFTCRPMRGFVYTKSARFAWYVRLVRHSTRTANFPGQQLFTQRQYVN